MHWRIQRQVKTDLGKYYCIIDNPQTYDKAIKVALTKHYSALLYYMLTDEHAITRLNFRYTQIAIMTTTWHSEKNQKYVKFDSIWMWVNAMLCQHICIPIPHEVRVKIVKRFNKLIDDKRRKLYIPTNKKCAS
jgi:hypothetical protein